MSPPPPFEVFPYTVSKLEEIYLDKTPISSYILNNKYHLKSYFPEYFNHVKPQTIVVENNYIDRDFLEDYAGFYVRCFKPPPRECTRLHFFSEKFDKDDFESLLSGANDTLRNKLTGPDAYLGFIVLKHLPETIIGRTCLRTYPPSQRRLFPATRDYDANLFGLQLKVQTLAFQEQDRVASACATSALWTVFNGTGMLFQHQLPSPFEITRTATEGMPIVERMVPNEGLNMIHIASAIRHVGLEPLLFSLTSNEFLKRTVRAYVDFGIPVMLLLVIGDELHVVAITGYSIPEVDVDDFIADRIDKLYVHDDQIGPFARMTFGNIETVEIDGNKIKGPSFTSSWDEKVVATNIIVPIYHKVRITHEHILWLISKFNAAIQAYQTGLIWDVRLTSVNKMKIEISQCKNISSEYRREILLEKMPRFLWRVTACSKNSRTLFDLLFDATDIEQGQFFTRAIEYDPDLMDTCRTLSNEIDETVAVLFKGMIEWFKRTPSPTIP